MPKSTQTKKVLVTGGAGYIGSQVCKLLHQAGYEPVTIDNLSKGRREAVRWGPLEVGDICDREFVSKVIKTHRPIGVIHFAANTEVGDSVFHPEKFYQNNVVGTLRLLEAMLENDLRAIVFSSTCATYGDVAKIPIMEDCPQKPINPYGWTKLMDEQMIKDFREAHGFRYTIFRYFNVAGADIDGELGEEHQPPCHVIPIIFDAVIGKTKEFCVFGTDFPTPDGTGVRDYIHVCDLADAHIRALEHLQTHDAALELNLGSEKGFSVKELIQHTEKISGKKVPVKNVARRAGDAPCMIADSSKAKKVLGWKPSHSDIDTILKTAWQWHQKLHQPATASHR